MPVGETKSEKFQRLGTLRANQILEDLRKLGNLSNRNHYEYSEDAKDLLYDRRGGGGRLRPISRANETRFPLIGL
jgi:hypothetical protein